MEKYQHLMTMLEKKTEISVKTKANIFQEQMILRRLISLMRHVYHLLIKGHSPVYAAHGIMGNQDKQNKYLGQESYAICSQRS